MKRLKEKYESLINDPRDLSIDIYKLMPILREYSDGYNHITEFGIRRGCSTYAFMMSKPKRIVSYDIARWDDITELESIAKESGIDFKFMLQDVLKAEIEETDILFIDSYHDYSQLKQELLLHANKVKELIIMHDTFTYGRLGEPAYNNLCESSGKGLLFAIEEFLQANKNWKSEYHTDENNGLTILKRIN